MAVDGEPYASTSPAGYPSVGNRDNPSSVLGNALEDRLREIKVLERRVTPSSSIVREGIVWWAEIGGSDHNGAWQAPFWVFRAPNLIARSAAQPTVEQSCAQSCCVRSIPLAVQVPIPTSTTHCPRSITAAIEGGVSIDPSLTVST